MFSKHPDRTVQADLSRDLWGDHDWKVGRLRSFEYLLDVVSCAIEPLSGLLAIGTASGAIHIFGGPGVEVKLTVPRSIRVKFLQYAASVYRLICVDDNDVLHIWDLAGVGGPKLLDSTKFPQRITGLTVSPSHAHAFIASQSGEIRTYDLLCLQKSPYTIPNMWTLYEGKVAGVGERARKSPLGSTPLDLVIHPRDLNLVFVAYKGGIILSDLTQRNTTRVYELNLPSGVGGAGHDFSKCSVTALAIHPTGHLLAVGYADGSIAFWAVDDDDKPLLVRTLDDEDVNVADGSEGGSVLKREPITKLSWCGFPDSSNPGTGDTALVTLGGLTFRHPVGLTILWIPLINLADTAVTQTSEANLSTRDDIRKSLTSSKTFLSTPGIVKDFLLIPRSSPHFSGAFDPVAVLLLCEHDGGTRSTEAYQLPRSSLKGSVSSLASTATAGTDDVTPSSPSVEKHTSPRQVRLPIPLWNGSNGVVGGRLLTFDNDAYEQLVNENESDNDNLLLKGGIAWTDGWTVSDKNLAKYQPPRLLVTIHQDLTIKFQDISAKLLGSSNQLPLQHAFPRPLPDLTINLTSVLTDPLVATRTLTISNRARVDSVHLARQSLECAVVLQTGEVVVYRLRSGPREGSARQETSDKELIMLEHIPPCRGRRFYPFLMVVPEKGRVTAFAISDIGFFAVAHGDGSLLVVDLRGPRILMRFSHESKAKNKEKLALRLKHHSELSDPIEALTWTVTTLGAESQLRVLLIAVHASGLTEVFPVNRPSGSDSWVIDGEYTKTRTVQHPIPGGIFVVDSKTGVKRKADGMRLKQALQSSPTILDAHGILIVTGASGAKCIRDITGEQLGKTDWGNKMGTVRSAEVIGTMGSHALVVFTDRNEAWVYSLPHLSLLQSLPIPDMSEEPLATDDTGDFIGWSRDSAASGLVNRMTYSSLFDIRRKYTRPIVDLSITKPSVPPQPQPILASSTSVLTSWLGFGQGMTGEQVDALCESILRQLHFETQSAGERKVAGPDRPPDPTQTQETEDASSASIAESSTAAVAGLYGRLSSALNERGQMLEGLEERFNSLEEGSRSMLAQAKRLAMEQSAKGWFGL